MTHTNTLPISANFQFALDSGYIEPALLPNGSQLEVEGIKYFVYANSGERFTQSRLYAFSDFLEESNRFVARKEDLQTNMQFIQETLEDARMMVQTEPKAAIDLITQAIFRAQHTQQRLELGASIERIFEISAIWFIQEGEDPEINDPIRNRRKVTDFKTKPELIGFFSRWAKNVWNALPKYSNESLLNAIRDLNLSEIIQNQIFTKSTSGVYSKTSEGLKGSLNSQTEMWASVNNTLDYLRTNITN